jgi:Ca2+-binding EF-hand superfamily protein
MIANESLMAREHKQKRRLGVALGWVAEQNQPFDMNQIEEAYQRFNLLPSDKDFLIRQFIH